MKFLCGNCKAKYQIADEKIAGRTLRMKCRRCSHDIVIRGEDDEAGSMGTRGGRGPTPRPAAASRSRGGSSVGPAPQRSSRRAAGSALGADFRRQVSTGAQEVPERVPTIDQWHVAINDVPVGPIRREEIARKVAAGAVNGESLCWREGFDDWRPVREVPELAGVLRQRPVAPPRPAKPVGRGVGGGARGGTGARPRPRPGARPTGTTPSARPEPSRPAARGNVVPIGGRLGAAAAPTLDPASELDDFEGEPTRVSDPLFDPDQAEHGRDAAAASLGALAASAAGVPDAPSAADPAPTFTAPPSTQSEVYRAPSRRLPVGAWIAIAGAGAFGMMLAAMVGTKLLTEDEPVAAVVPPPGDTQPAEPREVEPEIEVPVEEAPEGEGAAAEEESESESDGTGGASGPRRTGGQKQTGGGTSAPQKQLTAEQRALLARFAEEGGASPSNIAVADRPGADRNTGTGLNAQQLTAVVGRNRPALRRCYETAIRGMGDPPTIRMDVDVTVGSSGGVTRVNARGNDVGGLGSCLEAAVRRWRFPTSGNTTQTSFPVVFQPGG